MVHFLYHGKNVALLGIAVDHRRVHLPHALRPSRDLIEGTLFDVGTNKIVLVPNMLYAKTNIFSKFK